ncbi:MAG: hypothetical protein FWB96_13155 [Defluviitaleaceae bacterium]|nr:hypothetical protein [Defluviitaleaceae bacterium]MCL2264178.1 hypothetical protein [Defluviitaleaceae bacterium]
MINTNFNSIIELLQTFSDEQVCIADVSLTKEEFNKLYELKYSTGPVQLELNEGRPKPSSFDKSIKKALDYSGK